MNLFRVVIVDDEEIIREGIRDRIPWEELGYELAGAAENGAEALELFGHDDIDLLLTDICMPIMDGLELLKVVNETYPNTHAIVLSGHDEFEYAQQALKLGVKDYVLKPVTSKEIKELLLRMKEELQREKTEKNYKELLKRHMEESLPILRERFLNEWVSLPMDKEKVESRCTALSMASLLGPYQVIVFDLDHSNTEEEQLLQFAITEMVRESFSKDDDKAVFTNPQGQTVLIMAECPLNVHLDTKRMAPLQEVKELIRKRLNNTVTVGIGNLVVDTKEIHLSYRQAIDGLEYRFLMGNDQIIFIGDLENRKPVFSWPQELEKKLLANIKMGTLQDTHHLIQSIFSFLGQADVATCKWYVTDLVVSINKTFSDLDIDTHKLWGDPHQLLNDLHEHKTLNQIHDWLNEICQKANLLIQEKRTSSTRSQMDQAKAYIEQNYGDSDLTLGAVCDYLHVSPSYFSLIFKRETGSTFGEFLAKVRLEKAKQLLRSSDLKNYEIAEVIGYNDPQYFSTVFKKHVGVTPTEYRTLIN